MTEATTAYDEVAYPAWVYPVTEPSRMAAIAHIHGLAAPDPATARVLEIAGGDGLNMIAMGAAWPKAQFHSFDIARSAVARGQAIAAAAALDNVRIEVGDIVEAAELLEGPYDYIVVHGLYSWVPAFVREAALRLIGRVLAPEGIAFLSYNAKPGAYFRFAIRDMLLHEVAGIGDPAARMDRAHALLDDFIRPRPSDSPALAGLRSVAEPIRRRMTGSLFHDEMGEVYEPQALEEVVAAAAEHDLSFLNDGGHSMIYDGLPGAGVAEDEVVRIAQADDYQVLAFFHQTLLIRPGRQPRRGIVDGCLDGLWAASAARRTGPTGFALGEREIEVDDPELAAFIAAAAAAEPARLPVAPVAATLERCEEIIRLHNLGFLELHAAPSPAAAEPGEIVTASPLARAQVATGLVMLTTLDLKAVGFTEPGPRTFLSLLDGTRDRAALERDWAATEHGHETAVGPALQQFAKAALLLR